MAEFTDLHALAEDERIIFIASELRLKKRIVVIVKSEGRSGLDESDRYIRKMRKAVPSVVVDDVADELPQPGMVSIFLHLPMTGIG